MYLYIIYMNELLQKLLLFLHLYLFVILLIGPFLPGKYLIYYLFILPAIYVHWYFNDDRCLLTELAYNIDKNFYNSINEYYYYSKSSIFTFLKKINNYFPNIRNLGDKLDYFRSILWVIVFIRALIYYRKDIAKDWGAIRKHFIFRFLYDSYKR